MVYSCLECNRARFALTKEIFLFISIIFLVCRHVRLSLSLFVGSFVSCESWGIYFNFLRLSLPEINEI